MLNESAIWLVNTESLNIQMHFRISSRRMYNPFGFTMLNSSRYHRHLSNDVKRISKIDGMGPFEGKAMINCVCPNSISAIYLQTYK